MPGKQFADIPFPLAGIEEYRALTNGRVFNGRTSAAATQSAVNVRGVDPVSGRARGASRPGTVKFFPTAINGTESIQDIAALIGAASNALDFTGQIATNVRPDPATTGGNDPTGFQLYTPFLTASVSDTTLLEANDPGPTCWDSDGNAYFSYRESATSKFIIVSKYATASGTAFVASRWTTAGFSFAGTGILAVGMGVIGTTLYFYCRCDTPGEFQLWRFNTATGANLDSNLPWKRSGLSEIGTLLQPSAALKSIDNCLAVSGDYIGLLEISDPTLKARVFNTAGTLQTNSPFTLCTGSTTNTTYAINFIGDGDGNFFWSGFGAGESAEFIGRTTATGTTHRSAVGYHMAAYSPLVGQLFTLDASKRIVRMLDDLTVIDVTVYNTASNWSHIYATPTGGAVVSAVFHTVNFPYDLNMGAVNSGVVSIGLLSTGANDIQHNFMSVSQFLPDSADDLSYFRSAAQLVVAGGTVKKLSGTTATTVTNGTQALKTTAGVIFSAQVQDSIYFADGQSAKYYYGPSNSVLAWTPTAGSLPIDTSGGYHTLIAPWRNRAVVAGYKQDSTFIAASMSGNTFNFDYSPATVTVNDAWFQNLPDAINALVPYNDDILVVGCDHSIFQFTGDPTDGGRLDVISDTIGMAWGRPFCRSASGILFFVGSRGGVYRMVPSQIPEPISSMAINERLAEVNYSTHVIRMAWDDRQQGFYLLISPLDATAATTHYFYDARNNAWWADVNANVNHNPMAVTVLDGPSVDDRVVVFGGRDSILREVSLDAATDDGTTISSYVFMGPMPNTLLNELQITLDNASGNVTLSTHVGSSAQNALAASVGWSDTFAAGNNRSRYPKRYGEFLYLKLAATGYWSTEQLAAIFMPGSNRRVRVG